MTEREVLNQRMELVSKQYAWQGYLDYLKKWAKNHKEIENYGMTPACFDEWLDNEYEEE
ncbi:MAG: hypothetical protein J6S85_20070 [Methanobrevibacter sp.]|nr:hypothetical protein [Methanobrevibacter sp.]